MVTQIVTWSHRLLHGHTEITEITEIFASLNVQSICAHAIDQRSTISVISVISV